MSAHRATTRTAAAAGVVAVTALLSVVAPAAAQAAGTPGTSASGTSLTTAPTGWLRVTHLAPQVGSVNVFITPLDGSKAVVLHDISYGAFSSYRTVKPGRYAVAMRPVTAGAKTAAIASWQVAIKAGTAYTVAAVGTPGHLQSEVFTDALVQPAAGSARVRLIQGAPAAAAVSVTAVGGPLLAQGLTYGSITGYADVPQGHWDLKVTENGKQVATAVDVRSGGVYSLVVVQKANGALTLDTGVDVNGKPVAATGKGGKPVSMAVHTDAADSTTKPAGSVNTGEGGTAPLPTAAGGPLSTDAGTGVAALGLGALGTAAIAVSAARRRRVPTPR